MPVINSVESQHISVLAFHLDASLVQVKHAEKDQRQSGLFLHVQFDAKLVIHQSAAAAYPFDRVTEMSHLMHRHNHTADESRWLLRVSLLQ